MLMLLPASIARAEFSPRYAQLQQQNEVVLALTVQIDTLSPLSENSLALFNDFLNQSEIRLAAQGKHDAVSIWQNGKALLEIIRIHQADYTLTGFSTSQSAYLTNPGGKDALALLTDTPYALPDFSALPQVYAALAAELYPFLAQTVSPKASQTTTSIKNANASASYVNYTLKADQMNQIWPNLLEMLLPLIRDALAEQSEWYQEAETLLRNLVFSGECRFKRFLDKSKGDMGLQFTGNAQKGDDIRKVTLFGGYTPGKGGYISLSLPAVKGNNNFKISFTGKLTSKENVNTLSFESTYLRTLGEESASFTLEGTLKNTIKNGDENWNGKITLNTKTNGVSAIWTITPALVFTDAGLQGEIALQKKDDNSTQLKGTIFLKTLADQPFPTPSQMAAQDLRPLSETSARAVVAQEMLPLSRMLYQMMAQLPEESRALLTHDLRTDAWMNGESVPVIPQSPKDLWILDEDDENCWIVEEDEE